MYFRLLRIGFRFLRRRFRRWKITFYLIGETEKDIARDWLFYEFFELTRKDFVSKSEAKFAIYEHLEYLLQIIDDFNEGKDIDRYLQAAIDKFNQR